NTILGSAPLDANGKTTLTTGLFVGTHSLTASFFGVSGFAASTSTATTVTVSPAATTLTLASSVNPAVTGQAVTFTAGGAAGAQGTGAPTGTVPVVDGTVALGTVEAGARGTATFPPSFAAPGGPPIPAVFSGAPFFLGSSQSLTEQVDAAPTRQAT